MAEVIRQLHREHTKIARLLNALEHQLNRFEAAERPDYDILQGILEFCQQYPDRYHHPKEDLVMRRLRERDPEAAKEVGELEAEHEELARLTQNFREAIDNVLLEVEMPRENFKRVARHYLKFYWNHINMEEQVFFPAARNALTEADFAEIDAQITNPEDPVFGDTRQVEFEDLRRHLMAWERENEQAEAENQQNGA